MQDAKKTKGSRSDNQPEKMSDSDQIHEETSLQTDSTAVPTNVPKLPKTEGWPTRDQVVDMLQCTAQTIKNYEGRKLLHPREAVRKDRRGNSRRMLVYDPKELADLPFRNPSGNPKIMVHEPGEQAARAFEMFRNGDPLDDVVIELRMIPDRVDQLYERWQHHSKARLTITPDLKTGLERIFGQFTTIKELIELVDSFKHLPMQQDPEEEKVYVDELHGKIREAIQSKDPIVAHIRPMTGSAGWIVAVEWNANTNYACTLIKGKSTYPDTVAVGDDLETALRRWLSVTFTDLSTDHVEIKLVE